MLIREADNDTVKYLLGKYPHIQPVLCIGENSYTLVASENKSIIAFASVFRRKIPAPLNGKTEDFINVIDVFNPEDRNKGVASKLIDEIKKTAKKAKSIQVRAYCDINNAASHSLWNKNDFGISPVKHHDGSILGSFVTYRL